MCCNMPCIALRTHQKAFSNLNFRHQITKNIKLRGIFLHPGCCRSLFLNKGACLCIGFITQLSAHDIGLISSSSFIFGLGIPFLALSFFIIIRYQGCRQCHLCMAAFGWFCEGRSCCLGYCWS